MLRRAKGIWYVLMVSGILAGVNAARPAFGSSGAPNGGTRPIWSPDGTKLAFLSGTPSTPLDVWVVGIEGRGEPRRLTHSGARVTAWARDGSAVYCHTLRGRTSSFYEIDIASGERRPALTFLPQEAHQVVLSADLESVAYLLPHEKHQDLWVADMAGEAARQLTEGMYVRTAAWSHDGSKLAFDVGGVAGISTFVVSVSGEGEPVKVFGGVGSEPSWSPDDSRLAVLGMHSVTVVNANGTDAKRLHVSQADRSPLDWVNGGKGLAFTSIQENVLAISTVDVESGQETIISANWAYAGNARWSPDGRRLAFDATAVGGSVSDVYVLDAGADEPHRLTRGSASYWDAQVAGDDSSWVFLTNAGGAGRIELRVSGLDGGTPALKLRPRSELRVRWPAGAERGIAFGGKDLWLVSRTGEAQRLVSTAHPTWADLAPDGDSVAYVRWDLGKPSLVVRSLANGEEREVLPPPEEGLSYSKVSWSPRGDSIAFVRGGEVCTVSAQGRYVTVVWSGDPAGDSVLLTPEWSAEGKWLALGRFVQAQGQRLEILAIDAKGGGSQVVAECEVAGEPGMISDWLSRPYAWSSAEEQLAFCLEQDARPALYVAPMVEGSVGARTLVRIEAAFPAWNADGSGLIYTATEGNAERIRVYALSSGDDRVLDLGNVSGGKRETSESGAEETATLPERGEDL